jgi:RHS repeat-associated protein
MDYFPFNLRQDFDEDPAYDWNVEGALEQTGVAKHIDVLAFRSCDRLTGRFNSVDKLSSAMSGWNGYQMSFNNPMNFIDPTGLMPSTTYDGQNLAKEKSMARKSREEASKNSRDGGDDWVEDKNGNIYWDQNATSQSTTKPGEKYLGQAAVVFEGSRREQLGKGDNINGAGAATAKVTAYGPGGSSDVKIYKGFTMTSNAAKFTPIDDGEYTATYRISPGSTKIPKHFQMFESGKDNIRTLDGKINNNFPNQVRPNGDGYKDAIFIHRTNNNGWAGGKVSTGCLLLCPSDYMKFESQLKQVGVGVPFPVIVKR